MLRKDVLDITYLADKPLALAYDAQKDGWTATAFHKGVDEKVFVHCPTLAHCVHSLPPASKSHFSLYTGHTVVPGHEHATL